MRRGPHPETRDLLLPPLTLTQKDSTMAASDPKPTPHNFRYLVKPGTDFGFVAKFPLWILLSGILSVVAIGSLFVNTWVTRLLFDWYVHKKKDHGTISI